eukprot:TRINITY_DN5463_c0_g1_i1.p1 TRINITY_DN5463_c0_g1~~TRINITY_DN5463_c0_g1_i1.p1  ORF type:complete len:378 (+),score=131.50 TRINITY_DN5463_c0_g1_i1:191-1324(+)
MSTQYSNQSSLAPLNENAAAAKRFGQQPKRSVLGSIGNLGNGALQSKKPKTTMVTRSGPITRSRSASKLANMDGAMETTEDTVHQHIETLSLPEAAPVQLPPNVEDIDTEDMENPQMVSEYVTEIYTYMRELELKFKVDPTYFAHQPEVNEKMRSILVDWLVEVHYRFELLQETLYLTVHLMDRYLAAEKTERSKLQLVGVTAMLIASKYEEMYPPEVGDFVYISDNAYRRDQILAMEQKMLRVLDFNLGTPLPLHFLRRNSRAGRADGTMHTMAKYLMELTIGSAKMLHYVPSEIAAAATYISREIAHEEHLWNPTVEHYAHYSLAEIKDVITDMKHILANSVTSKFQAVRSKFSRSKYMRISKDPQLESYIAQMA